MNVTYSVCPSCQGLNKVQIESMKSKDPVCGSCGTALPFDGAHQNVDDKSLRKLMAKSPQPVVIDFWASWCGPCQAFGPTFAEAALEFLGKAIFVKLNTEEHPQISAELGIRGIPSIVCIQQGKEKGRQSGALPMQMLKQWLNNVL